VDFAHSGVGASFADFLERGLAAGFFAGFLLAVDFALGVDRTGIL